MKKPSQTKRSVRLFLSNILPALVLLFTFFLLTGFDFIRFRSDMLNRIIHQYGSSTQQSPSSGGGGGSSGTGSGNVYPSLEQPIKVAYPAIITDEIGRTMEATDVVHGFEQVIRVNIGRTTMTIPYSEIDRLVVQGVEKMDALVTILTRDGNKVDGSVYRYLSFNFITGNTNYTYLIQDLKKIDFLDGEEQNEPKSGEYQPDSETDQTSPAEDSSTEQSG